MENAIFYPANTRGHANYGWLNAHHTFSFAGYRNPERMHFGVIRVLNDDIVAGGMGFGTHPHDNMEIITIPLAGDLAHKDSMGNEEVIKSGDIQVMSAGTGVEHSEFNANKDKAVNLFQIWLFPNKRNVTPRYDQMTLNIADRHNKLQQILSPNSEDEGVWIHQDAWFSMGTFEKGLSAEYALKRTGNGIFAMVVKGDFTINNQEMHSRDGFGIWDVDKINITSNSEDAEILLMDVPMEI